MYTANNPDTDPDLYKWCKRLLPLIGLPKTEAVMKHVDVDDNVHVNSNEEASVNSDVRTKYLVRKCLLNECVCNVTG